MRRFILVFTIAMVLGFAGSSGATLYDRGGGMIYDADRNITWYDFTYHSTSWDDAKAWADGLSLPVNGVTYDDWRLPTALNPNGGGPCSGFNCTESEMGHLYYTELGKSADGPLGDTSPFTALQPSGYWSGTEYGSGPDGAWVFAFHVGYQLELTKGYDYYALAVHSGNVGAPVPVPGTILLLGSGLVGLIGLRKGKGRRHPG